MKNINEVFDDEEFKHLEKIKDNSGKDSWHDTILKWANFFKWGLIQKNKKHKGGKKR